MSRRPLNSYSHPDTVFFFNGVQSALTKTTGIQHKNIRMNPKAIRAEEMFGETNKASGEWVDGVFAAMWSKFNDRTRKDMQVLVESRRVNAGVRTVATLG